MEMKIMAAAVAAALLAFAGIAFAAPNYQQNAGSGSGRGMGMNVASHMDLAEHGQFEAAVESGNFAAAKALHEKYGFGGRMFDSLDAASFAKFSEMHKAMDVGDFEKAQQMRNELRPENGFGKGAGRGAGNGGCSRTATN